MNEELIEKCRLTDEEIDEIENEYPRKFGLGITVAKAQLAKAIPLISAEARKQERERIIKLLMNGSNGTLIPWPSEGEDGINSRQRRILLDAIYPDWQALKEGGK